jgi:hypothetical protein
MTNSALSGNHSRNDGCKTCRTFNKKAPTQRGLKGRGRQPRRRFSPPKGGVRGEHRVLPRATDLVPSETLGRRGFLSQWKSGRTSSLATSTAHESGLDIG